MPFDRSDLDAASTGDDSAMLRVLTRMADMHDGVIGILGADPTTGNTAVQPPPPATITVTSSNGHFQVQITNPLQSVDMRAGMWRQEPSFDFTAKPFGTGTAVVQRRMARRLTTSTDGSFTRRILHQLESSLDANWDANSSLVTYGPSTDLAYDITDPNTTRFWRVKSRYENSDFGDYVYFTDPAVCGLKGVASGQLASLSAVPNMQSNTTTFATVDSFDAGASATIRVYGSGGVGTSWTRQVGATTDPSGPFPAATLTGYAYNTHYWALYDLDAGSYVVYTDAQFPSTLTDNLRFAGDVTTLGTGTPAGAAATANLSAGVVVSATITAAGSNYAIAPTVAFSGGGGSGAAAIATVSGGAVVGVTITNGGSGYATPPAIAFSGGSSSGQTGGGGSDGGPGGRFSSV